MFCKKSETRQEYTILTRRCGNCLLLCVGALLISSVALAGGTIPTSWSNDSNSNGSASEGGFSKQTQPIFGDNSSLANAKNDNVLETPLRVRSRDPGLANLGQQPPSSIPARRSGHDDETSSEVTQIQHKLTVRYGNPATVRLLHSLSHEQSLAFYLEVSALIDTRHLKPSSYDARVKQAAKNLCQALENQPFLQANGVANDPARIDYFRRDILQLVNGRTITGAEDAYQAVQWTMRTGDRDLGLQPAAIAVEFVFGATDSLDKFSGFVPVTGKNTPSAELEDHIVGIGVEITLDERGVLITHILPGSPAAEAALKRGDVIESINGRKLLGGTLESAVDLIVGPAGSQLTLGVRHDERLVDVTLVRRRVEVHSVSEVKMFDQQVGYIKLDKFAQNSATEFDNALWSLYGKGMKSLIVDLRGNPGGLLTTAIRLSDKFVPNGTIVATRGRNSDDNMLESAPGKRAWKIPLVVLVDENSASASEIFAAAVQENGRGLIVGRRTYGKGTVQTHFPLQTVSGDLRLTTAQFFSPKGRVMAGAGVEPDVRVLAEGDKEQILNKQTIFARHEATQGSEGVQHHEAAYRRGVSEEPKDLHDSDGTDRDLAAALNAATSSKVFDMARAAGNSLKH